MQRMGEAGGALSCGCTLTSPEPGMESRHNIHCTLRGHMYTHTHAHTHTHTCTHIHTHNSRPQTCRSSLRAFGCSMSSKWSMSRRYRHKSAILTLYTKDLGHMSKLQNKESYYSGIWSWHATQQFPVAHLCNSRVCHDEAQHSLLIPPEKALVWLRAVDHGPGTIGHHGPFWFHPSQVAPVRGASGHHPVAGVCLCH